MRDFRPGGPRQQTTATHAVRLASKNWLTAAESEQLAYDVFRETNCRTHVQAEPSQGGTSGIVSMSQGSYLLIVTVLFLVALAGLVASLRTEDSRRE